MLKYACTAGYNVQGFGIIDFGAGSNFTISSVKIVLR